MKHYSTVFYALYPLKGLHNFIPAIQILKSQYKDVTVHIAGPNPIKPNPRGEVTQYGRYIETLLNQYNVTDVVSFLGVVSEKDMIKEYAEASVFVVTSSIENSCNSLCEAQYLGVHSIGTFVGGIPDLIRNGEDGFLYPADEPYMAAHYIASIFDDDDLQHDFSLSSMRKAVMRHERSQIVKINNEIYRSIGKK